MENEKRTYDTKKIKSIITTILVYCLLFLITVSAEAANVKLTPKDINITVGSSYTIQLKGAKKKGIIWSTSDNRIIKLKKSGTKCKVTGIAKGKTIITATYKGKIYKCTVTVNVPVLSKSTLNMKYRQKTKIQLLNLDTGFKASQISWSTSNKRVIKISRKKKNSITLTAQNKVGTAIITAKYKGKKYKCKVNVASKVVSEPKPLTGTNVNASAGTEKVDNNKVEPVPQKPIEIKANAYVEYVKEVDKALELVVHSDLPNNIARIQVSKDPDFHRILVDYYVNPGIKEKIDFIWLDGFGTYYVRTCCDNESWSAVKTIKVSPQYSYSLRVVNPFPDVYTENNSANVLLYIKTDNPNTNTFSVTGGNGKVSYMTTMYCPDLEGGTPYASFQSQDPRGFYKVKGGYLVEVTVSEPGMHTFYVEESVDNNPPFGKFGKTGVSTSVNVKDYDLAFNAWINSIIRDAGLTNGMTQEQKMNAICSFILNNYRYPTNIEINPLTGDFEYVILYNEMGTYWQKKQLDSMNSPSILLKIADIIGYKGLHQMDGYMHAYITDGSNMYTACNGVGTGTITLDSIKKVDLSK